jgi:Ras-related protein Rab-1A
MTDSKIKRKVLRLSILGDSKTGKSSIINRYLGNEFSEDMISNIGIDKQELLMTMKDGNEMKIIIWDTAGQERFHSISSTTIKNSQGIIVCFAINDKNSFNNVLQWLQDIRDVSSKIPIVLFGNKCDLEDKREVSTEEVKKKAEVYKMAYCETSALNAQNIDYAFQTLIKLVSDNIEKKKYEENKYGNQSNVISTGVSLETKIIAEENRPKIKERYCC